MVRKFRQKSDVQLNQGNCETRLYSSSSSGAGRAILCVESKRRPTIEVDYCDRACMFSLDLRGHRIAEGELSGQLLVDEIRQSPVGPWLCRDWHSDARVDSLELEMSLSNQWRIRRQLTLLKE